MGTLYRLEDAPGRRSKSSRQRLFFNRSELNRLLSLYMVPLLFLRFPVRN